MSLWSLLAAHAVAGLAVVLAPFAVSFGACVGARAPEIFGWTPPSRDREVALSFASPWACDACGAPLGRLARVPLVGFLRGCTAAQCAGPRCGPLHLPAFEWAGLVATIAIAWYSGTLALVWVLWCFLCAGLSACDREAAFIPALFSVPLLFAGVALSPCVILSDRIVGALVFLGVGLFLAWRIERSCSPERSGGAPAHLEVALGGGDLYLLCAVGAWLGPVGATVSLALCAALAHVRAKFRSERSVPLAPLLLPIASVAVLLHLIAPGLLGPLLTHFSDHVGLGDPFGALERLRDRAHAS